MYSRVQSVRLTFENVALPPPWSNSVRSEEQLLFDSSVAMNILFRIFGDARFDLSILQTNSYPPFPLRRAIASISGYGFVAEYWDVNLKEKALRALRSALKYTEHAFAVILGEPETSEGLSSAFSSLGQQQHRLLAERFDELQQRLAPFRYEATLCYR
jgi:hypothetical protein